MHRQRVNRSAYRLPALPGRAARTTLASREVGAGVERRRAPVRLLLRGMPVPCDHALDRHRRHRRLVSQSVKCARAPIRPANRRPRLRRQSGRATRSVPMQLPRSRIAKRPLQRESAQSMPRSSTTCARVRVLAPGPLRTSTPCHHGHTRNKPAHRHRTRQPASA